ncbi:MAG: DUF2089 family protein [Sedimentisphaerales bacterium]|jgi:hypothetical protein
MAQEKQTGNWTQLLTEEDVGFIKRFTLASGSLKEMAKIYDISYPTIRLRLDRLIEKIKVFDAFEKASEFELLIRSFYAEGKIDTATFKTLLTAHKKEMETQK